MTFRVDVNIDFHQTSQESLIAGLCMILDQRSRIVCHVFIIYTILAIVTALCSLSVVCHALCVVHIILQMISPKL